MSFRVLMQAGPAKANDLFARLSDTSDGAVKTREKLFAELKSELELHISLEELHLFPILRRNAETKGLVADAIKDNKELRAKLAELDGLPKNDEAFPERLKELQKTFRQHARDEKRELLPAVQRALSEEQVQSVAEKIEAGVAEAERAKHDEVEQRRLKARQEREEAERLAERQAEAERARKEADRIQKEKAAAERAQQEEAEQRRARARLEREQAQRQAEQEAAAMRAQEKAEQRIREAAETAARTATAAQAGVLQVAEKAATRVQRLGAEVKSAADAYLDTVRTSTPDLQAVASLPSVAIGAMMQFRSAWIEWVGQTALARTRMSQELLQQAAEQQRRFGTNAVQSWVEQNARVMDITLGVARESLSRLTTRSEARSDEQKSTR
jgi:hemerythrin HHE cation binding domain-containing protein